MYTKNWDNSDEYENMNKCDDKYNYNDEYIYNEKCNHTHKGKKIVLTEEELDEIIAEAVDDCLDELVKVYEDMPDDYLYLPEYIEDIWFRGPATIVWWDDGTKTVSVCSEKDTYDYEKGIAMCMLKKLVGDGSFNDVFKIWSPQTETNNEEENNNVEEDKAVVMQLLDTKKLTDRQKEAIKNLIKF